MSLLILILNIVVFGYAISARCV